MPLKLVSQKTLGSYGTAVRNAGVSMALPKFALSSQYESFATEGMGDVVCPVKASRARAEKRP